MRDCLKKKYRRGGKGKKQDEESLGGEQLRQTLNIDLRPPYTQEHVHLYHTDTHKINSGMFCNMDES